MADSPAQPPKKERPPILDILSREIRGISSDIQAMTEESVKTVSEQIFVQVFLPLFAGDKELPYKVTMQHWLNMAGGWFNEVAIVNDRGEELFRTPPLADRNLVAPGAGKHKIAHAVITAQQYSAISPADSEAYIRNSLAAHLNSIASKGNTLHFIQRWNDIMVRYGRQPLTENIKSEQAKLEEKKKEETNLNLGNDDWELL